MEKCKLREKEMKVEAEGVNGKGRKVLGAVIEYRKYLCLWYGK